MFSPSLSIIGRLVFYVCSGVAQIVKIPKESLLNPTPTAAVCGGNVLTSQRIVDVVLKAFNACAASQGCCKYVALLRLIYFDVFSSSSWYSALASSGSTTNTDV